MRVTLIEHRHAQHAATLGQSLELVPAATADEAEAPHDIELLGVQQMHGEAPRLEDHVVAVVELVDVHRQPRNGRYDRGAHRGIGDHAVLLAVALRCDCDDGRCEIAEELVCEGGLKHTSRYMATVAS